MLQKSLPKFLTKCSNMFSLQLVQVVHDVFQEELPDWS